MTNTTEVITVSQPHTGILQIHLNRPQQLNALNKEVLTRLSQILNEAKTDTAVKALLLTGEGKAFCAGADIKELAVLDGKSALTFAKFGQNVFRQLETLGKPSLAAIQGFAFGGGAELAMAATMRMATETALFGQPEINLGVIPGFGGTQRLARLIGKGRAMDLCLTGKRFSAKEALAWGFITETTKEDELVTKAYAYLKKIINFGTLALQSIMNAIDQGYNLSLEEGLELEAAYFALCCTSADKKEGVDAFMNKRTPVFNGE